MIGLFTVTLGRLAIFWALVSFLALQFIVRFIFDFVDMGAVKEYYRKKGNYMSEEEEMIYLYNKKNNTKIEIKKFEKPDIESRR